jgi:Na+/melibiose symporter-like transporter
MALLFGIYLPRHYVGLGIDGFGPGTKSAFLAVTFAITVTRLIDLAFDPLVALVMDWTKTPIGRYRPWILLGAPLVTFGIYKVLMPNGTVTSAYLTFWLVVTYAGLSMLNIGLAAWGAVLAPSYNDRSRVFALQQFLGVVGSVMMLSLPLLTHGRIAAGVPSAMPTLGLILVVAFPTAIAICTGLTPERLANIATRPKFALKDYARALGRPTMARLIIADLVLAMGPGMTGPLHVYYFHEVKGFTVPDFGVLFIAYIASGLVGAPFWGRASARFGKHRVLQFACLSFVVTQTILILLPPVHSGYTFIDSLPIVVGMFSVGFSTQAFALMVRSMVADVSDEVKLEVRQDLTSLLFSMVTTTGKIGSSITVLFVFPVLAFVGFNGAEGAVNSRSALFGLQMLYWLPPIILAMVGAAAFVGYKLDSTRHAEIRQRLYERDFAGAEEAVVGPVLDPPATTAPLA